MSEKEARKNFWLIDRDGLLIKGDPQVSDFQVPYARDKSDVKAWPIQHNIDLLTVVRQVAPTILVGTSTVRGAFTEEIITTMASKVALPIIFPLSNPTENCEAQPLNVLQWTQGKALIATGSPFDPVQIEGHTYEVAQCNNALSFPGIGLGIIATRASKLTDNMLWAASLALSELSPVRSSPTKPVLPNIKEVRRVALLVAQKVAEAAIHDNVARVVPSTSILDLINANLWQPYYREIRPGTKK